ncbi:MAG: 23S rRNA (uracil(1939)-C(5))-methyltransferase RlmD [Deltaproteobacteria bacterium]|nr:MAG: 23S rRNA (uracil(1939)-C(5))-methyltransferase RlmD [Deltaproteobacteria bacterium]
MQVVLVLKERPRLAHMDLLRRLRRRLASLSGLLVNINPRRTNVIFGRRFETLWGTDKLSASFMGLNLALPPASFFQVNTEQAERLFGRALDFIGNRPGKLADIYCGTGVTALLAAERADRVVGIDSDDAAIRAASANARLNGATNTEFMAGRAEALLPRLVAQGLKPDCIVLDPPRAGCAKEVLEAICSSGCERIAYISCNPGTLARDLKLLLARGYRLARLECFDMFPQTVHVEVLAGLER